MKKLSLILCLFLWSCSKDKLQPRIAIGEIFKTESLQTISLGQSDTITVTFGGGSGCAAADHLETNIAGNVITFKAFYKEPSGPVVCPAVVPVHQLKYIFKPVSKGNYIYKSFDNNVSSETTVN